MDDGKNDSSSIVGNGNLREEDELEGERAVFVCKVFDFNVFVTSDKGIRFLFACRPD